MSHCDLRNLQLGDDVQTFDMNQKPVFYETQYRVELQVKDLWSQMFIQTQPKWAGVVTACPLTWHAW